MWSSAFKAILTWDTRRGMPAALTIACKGVKLPCDLPCKELQNMVTPHPELPRENLQNLITLIWDLTVRAGRGTPGTLDTWRSVHGNFRNHGVSPGLFSSGQMGPAGKKSALGNGMRGRTRGPAGTGKGGQLTWLGHMLAERTRRGAW